MNDKYPISIVYTAFFSLGGDDINVDSIIGFDDRSLKTLKAVNHPIDNLKRWRCFDACAERGVFSAE